MIDEYESEYAPDTDMGPRNLNEEIGEFSSLAFMKKKTFLKNPDAEKDLLRQREMEAAQQLLAQNQRKVEIICNTALLPRNNYTFIMGLSDKVFDVFDLISDAVSRDSKKRQKIMSSKFVVLEIMEDQSKVRNTRESEILEGMYGGYNAFGQDARVIDPETIVKNLKSSKIEIREKIFVDKPVHKQLEVTLELKEELNPLKQAKARNNGSAGASYDIELDDREEKKQS